MFSTRAEPAEMVLTPLGVKETAERIFARGPTLADAGMLFLAATYHGTHDGRLAPWLLVWEGLPRSPLDPDSPAAIAILEAAQALADAHVALTTAQRAEPDLERHLERVRESLRADGYREFDRADLQQRASQAARQELEDRRAGAERTIALLEGNLKTALRNARKGTV